MPEPKFYTRNYIDTESTYFTGNFVGDESNIYPTTSVPKAFDRDNDSQFISVGADDDTTLVVLTFYFYEGGIAISRIIDTVIMLNHNWKNFTIEYWDGSTWTHFADGINQTENSIISAAGVEAKGIRMYVLLTQTADQEKAIGEIIACSLYLDLEGGTIAAASDLVDYSPGSSQKSFDMQLANGNNVRTVVMNSPNRSDKYEAKASFRYLDSDQLEALRFLKNLGEPFIWQPESEHRPAEVYFVYWIGNFSYRYVTSYKGAGFQLDMQVKEV